MPGKAIIVIGASAGGVGALRTIAAGLAADIGAPICVVQHVGRHRSELPKILAQSGPLPAAHAEDGEALTDGRIYVAPPDCHLLIDDGRARLTHGPRENFARPAIDPLFRTAAESCGARAIGVILSGRLSDGAAGLYEIKRRGGAAVVQSPEDAEHPDMPASALAHVAVDYNVAVADLAPLLARLVGEKAGEAAAPQPEQEAIEMNTDYALHRPVSLTCPNCGGAVERNELGTLTRYRCHIGHAYTGAAMASAQFENMESGVERALRLINERIEMCRQMAERPDVPDESAKAAWLAAMEEAEQRADAMSELVSAGWLSPEE
jgi:two-component system chemotaxis response regulator CheB